MASIFPITLSGDNLGIRHKYINDLVKKAYDAGNEDFKNIQNIPEKSAIDRLFKIDLASKHRYVDFIMQNLKDSDILYVSRALKSKWLLNPEYKQIINPEYLEDSVYPNMVTTAVNKMKHWVHLNLKDEQRLEEFYKYYSEKDFDLAMKFLVKSSKEFIKSEFLKIVHRVTPKHLKVLCEKSPEVAKIFFDLLPTDETVKSRYMSNERNYYNSIKCLLKSDTSLYLDITEKYYNHNQFGRYSPIATKFIMSHHKDRFWKKPELYTAWLLDIGTLADTLNVEEVKILVETLARAQYLQSWFVYKEVEPLIKRLKPEDRAAFKKKVFVQKDIGDIVEQWPYKTPSAPPTEDLGPDIFEDSKHDPYEYACLVKSMRSTKRRIMKKKCMTSNIMMCEMTSCDKVKTLLDKLFDEYRFASFEKTFYELKKRILAESSPQNRQFIMLVLISKTGGRADAIAILMELLARHRNEPPNLRAAIIRSLVKRAFIWRLPEETWKKLLEFGQGLGLDGKQPEADCVEGLHSVFIRSLLQGGTCNNDIFNAFLDSFSDLSTYSLTSAEKKCIGEALPKMLLTAAKEKVKVENAISLIDKLIEVLRTYKIKIETYLDFVPTVVGLAEKDYSTCSYLLENLFNARVGRKALFPFTYKLIKTDASHVNALKHDINVLDFEIFYESCLNGSRFDRFFRKITLYFKENEGLAIQYKNKLKEKEHNKFVSRPLAILLGSELGTYLQELDKEEKVESKVFSAAVRANAHMTRPSLDIDSFGWHKAGVKAIANKLITCPSIDLSNNIQKLLKWKRTARLAFELSNRTQNLTDVFVTVANLRPTIGIKLGIKLLKKQGDSYDTKVWGTIMPLIRAIDLNKNKNQFYVKKILNSAGSIPINIRPEYNIIIFKAFDVAEAEPYAAMSFLCRLEHQLPNVSEEFIETILSQFLDKEFTLDKNTDNDEEVLCKKMYLRIIFKYIYISKSEEDQKRRFETFGNKVLDRLTDIYNATDTKETFFQYLDEIMLNFKNTEVFMNPEYVSCLPVMKNTINWFRIILPVEQNFDIYATIHLTMLYYKTIRQTVTQTPEVFVTERKKYKKGVKIVGNLFGKHIAKEVKGLMETYYESIVHLYNDTLVSYLDNYFDGIQSSDFLSSMIKGILEEGKDEVRLGIYLFNSKSYYIASEVSAEIKNSFREVKDEKNRFFVFAEIFGE